MAKVLASGRFVGHPLFPYRFIVAGAGEKSEWAVVIPTKTAKLASKRNYIKRRLRHLMIKLAPQLVPGLKIVFFPKTTVAEVPFVELERVLAHSLTLNKVINV